MPDFDPSKLRERMEIRVKKGTQLVGFDGVSGERAAGFERFIERVAFVHPNHKTVLTCDLLGAGHLWPDLRGAILGVLDENGKRIYPEAEVAPLPFKPGDKLRYKAGGALAQEHAGIAASVHRKGESVHSYCPRGDFVVYEHGSWDLCDSLELVPPAQPLPSDMMMLTREAVEAMMMAFEALNYLIGNHPALGQTTACAKAADALRECLKEKPCPK